MDTLRGIPRADLANLRRMSKHILLDGKLSHKQQQQQHEYPSATKDASKDDATVELGKVLSIGEAAAVVSEHSLRGLSKAELLRLTKMAKEVLLEGKSGDKEASWVQGVGAEAEGTSTPRSSRTGTPKTRGGQLVYTPTHLLSEEDDSTGGDSRNSTPDRASRRPQRVHPPSGSSSSRSRLVTIVDEELSLSSRPTDNDDKAHLDATAGPAVLYDLNMNSSNNNSNQPVDQEELQWSLENSLRAERSRRESLEAQKVTQYDRTHISLRASMIGHTFNDHHA